MIGNEAMRFQFLKSSDQLTEESIFTGLNNLNVMTVLDPYYCDSFGFTENEVVEPLQYYGLENYQNIVREWYDGCLFGNVSIYCPWDVIKYAQILLRDRKAEPENYWANTSGNDIIRHLLEKADQTTRDEVEQLISGGSIVKSIRQELTYREIDASIDNLWSVLYSTGYLTHQERLPGKQMRLMTSNRVVRELFMDLVKDWFRDTAVRRNMKENFYHGMVLGVFRSQGNWLIQSNVETKERRKDTYEK